MQLTPRTKRVIDLAWDEAQALNNNYVGTEHLLLGLIREGEGLAAQVLRKTGMDLESTRATAVRLQIEDARATEVKLAQSLCYYQPDEYNSTSATADNATSAHLSLSFQQVLSYAFEETVRLNEKYVSTEHLLLGINTRG